MVNIPVPQGMHVHMFEPKQKDLVSGHLDSAIDVSELIYFQKLIS